MKEALCWLDRNFEKVIMLTCYLTLSGIIFVEVVRRFLLNQQAPWSTTIPIYLFLFLTWMGAAYNTRARSHLAFNEFRKRMPCALQFVCSIIDAIVWTIFGVVMAYYTIEQVRIIYQNFSIVPGTYDLPLWWFYLATPIGGVLIVFRALQNLWDDCGAFSRGESLIVDEPVLSD